MASAAVGEDGHEEQQALIDAEVQGQPISGEFEVDEGALQLSVYTSKDDKFFEMLVDDATGSITESEPITEGNDLADAKSQSAAMAKAKFPSIDS